MLKHNRVKTKFASTGDSAVSAVFAESSAETTATLVLSALTSTTSRSNSTLNDCCYIDISELRLNLLRVNNEFQLSFM